MITPTFPVPEDSKGLLDRANQAADLALKAGANSARASLYRSQSCYLQLANGELERLEQSTRMSLSMQLYVDGRYSAHTTNDLRPDALRSFVETAVGLTRLLQPDPDRALPPPEVYQRAELKTLAIDDPHWSQLRMEARKADIGALNEAAQALKASVIRIECGVSDDLSEQAVVNTNGFAAMSRGTRFSSSISLVGAEPEGRRVGGDAWFSTRERAGLPDAASVAAEAARRLSQSLGARPISTRTLPMLVQNRAAGRLLMSLVQPMSAYSLQQRQSCLEGKLGQAVGSPLLTLTDDPHIPTGLGSRLFDGEGVPAQRRTLFEGGVLKSYLVDTYYGKKLGWLPNGGGLSNVLMPPGSKALDRLWADAGESILVTGFLGGNSNPTTGDFSFGITGLYRDASGAIKPITEMNVAGNLTRLWQSLEEVGSDPWEWSSFRLPTLRFGAQSFSGV